MTTPTLVTGLVKVGPEVDVAVSRILALGYAEEDLSVIMTDETRGQHFGANAGTVAASGAVGGAVAAILLEGASFLVPGIHVVVAGPLAAAVMGVGGGGATEGAVGLMVSAGIPEDRAIVYEAGLAAEMIVLGVRAKPAEVPALEQIFREVGVTQTPFVVGAHDERAATP